MTLYERLCEAGYKDEIGNSGSDLYVPVTDKTKEIVYGWLKENGYSRALFAVTFQDLRTGALTYEIPFAYDPYWNARRG